MKEIELSQGYKALVDDADFEWLSQWKWSADVRPHTVYAVRRCKDEDGYFPLHMHRAIMQPPDGLTVDHRNRNGLDNQRDNLRHATGTQQQANKVGHGQSGVKGVSFHRGRWRAVTQVEGRQVHLGRFDTIEEAAAAYKEATYALHGEFVQTTSKGGNKK